MDYFNPLESVTYSVISKIHRTSRNTHAIVSHGRSLNYRYFSELDWKIPQTQEEMALLALALTPKPHLKPDLKKWEEAVRESRLEKI